MHTIYMASNKINGKRYIGVTGKSLADRKGRHIRLALRGRTECPRLYDAIRKYGVKAFRWEVLATFSVKEFAYHHEMVLVADLAPEYNVVRGGNMGPHVNLHNRKPVICLEDGLVFKSGFAAGAFYKISQACISAVCLGKRETAASRHFGFFDVPLSEMERRAKIADAVIVGTSRRQRVEKVKLSGSMPMVNGIDKRGKRWAGPAKASKEVICLDNGGVFESCHAAAYAVGTDAGSMSRACRLARGYGSVKGQHFAYVRDVGHRMMA